jgi:predicted dehydrogenase
MTKKKTSRRSFLGASAALGTAFWVAPQTFGRPTRSALEGLTAACIGVGGKGDSDSSHIADQDVEIVGICEVDKRTLAKKSKEFTKAEQFTDFREMLDKLGDKIDIVSVSTPDHTHASAAVKAMKMKKHVYVQKPLTWSIREARIMREVAAETGVVTQMGNQGTAEDGLREAVEVIRSGAIGSVSELHVWTNRPVWPQGIGRPKGEDTVPDYLDWDSWIGPAQMRPYKEGVYHSFNWRGWVDFGTGALGDMACHTTNMPVMALELWDPTAVTAVKNPGIVEGETFPGATTLMFEFPERNGLAATKFYWYDGGSLPSDDLVAQLPEGFRKRIAEQKKGGAKTSAALVIGSKGMLLSENDYGAAYSLLPDGDFKGFKKPDQSIPRIPFKGSNDERNKWEFVETCRGNYKPGTMSNFGYAGRLTETILVGNLAVRAGEGQRIEWDAKNLVSTNLPDLNQYVQREYREGWSL